MLMSNPSTMIRLRRRNTIDESSGFKISNMSKTINFQFQKFKDLTVVALDSKLEDYQFTPVMEGGKMVLKRPERTVKDCRHIDGCVYLHLGRVSDRVMTDLIELFQKVKAEKNWKPNNGISLPNLYLGLK